MIYGMNVGLVLIIFALFFIISSVKIIREYERAVVFRLGRLLGAPTGRSGV